MRLIDTKCSSCGAGMTIDYDKNQLFCPYCGAKLLIDDEKKHLVIDNAKESGYQFEKGRQEAIDEKRRKDQLNSFYQKQQKSTEKILSPEAIELRKLFWSIVFFVFSCITVFEGFFRSWSFFLIGAFLMLATFVFFAYIDKNRILFFIKDKPKIKQKRFFKIDNFYIFRFILSAIGFIINIVSLLILLMIKRI